MIKGYRIQIFPTKEQEEKLWQHINASRFVWNKGIEIEEQRYHNNQEHLSGYKLRSEFTSLKQTEEFAWLKNISAHTISEVCSTLDKAYYRYFLKECGKPKFKSKKQCKNTFPVRQDAFYFSAKGVNIGKVGKINYKKYYKFPLGRNVCKFSEPRITNVNGKWILSFSMFCKNQTPTLNDFSVGIDLGVKELAVIAYKDKSIVFESINKTPKVKNLEQKLRHLQRKLSRQYSINNRNNTTSEKWGVTRNIKKTQSQIKKIYKELSDIRHNYIHQVTSEIIKLYPKRVVMENLNIKGMMKNRCLSKAISDQCLYDFIQKMKYKCEFNGIEFVQVDRFYPSSKTCSCCGAVKQELKLSDRIYCCEKCGTTIDRDLNAAINLMNYKKI